MIILMNKNKLMVWLLFFLFTFSLFSSVFIVDVIADNPNINIIPIKTSQDYLDYGFSDLGVYYTPNSISMFHMPFIVPKTGVFNNLNKYDLDVIKKGATPSFNKRFISHDFSILAENKDYYVVDFSMNVKADVEKFSVDFIPVIKGISFPDFSYWNSSWGHYVPIVINPSGGAGYGYSGWVNETINASSSIQWTGMEYDSSNRPHICYISGSKLYYTFRDSNSVWRGQIDTDSADEIDDGDRSASIILDDNDIPHIVYIYDGTPDEMRYAVWNNTGSSWDIETFDTDTGYAAFTAKDYIGINTSGNPCIAYVQGDQSAYNFTVRADNGTWRGIENTSKPDIVIGGGAGGNFWSMTMDGDTPHIAGSWDDPDRDVIYVTYDSGWTWTNIRSACGLAGSVGGADANIKLDLDGYPHVLVHDGTGTERTRHLWETAGGWVKYENVNDTDCDYPDFVFNSSGAMWATMSHPTVADKALVLLNKTGDGWVTEELDRTSEPGSICHTCLDLMTDDSVGIAFQTNTGFYYYVNNSGSDPSGYNYVDVDLPNFPILINVSAAISAECDSGESIRFLNVDNTTEYYYDIDQTWIDNRANYVWVNLTTLNSSSKQMILMYYNNSEVSTTESSSTWDTNYLGVYHMNISTTKSYGCYDSSTYGYHAIYKDSLPDHNTGKIGYGQDFDGADDWLQIPSSLLLPITGTIEFWFEPDNVAKHTLLDMYQNQYNYITILPYNDQRIEFRGEYSDTVEWDIMPVNISYDANEFFYFAGSYTTDDVRYRFNERLNGTDTSASPTSFSHGDIRVGTNKDSGNDADGVIDEYRVSRIARNQSWLKASYHSMNHSSGFVTLGSIVSSPMTPPSNFNATTTSSSSISLSWTKGAETTDTLIRYKTTGYPTSTSDGTSIYNSDGESVTHSSLSCNTTYYYRAWGYNSTVEGYTNYISISNITGPGAAYNYSGIFWEGTLNISWYIPSNADTTLLIRKTGSFSTTYDDGTVLWNSSNTTIGGYEHFNDTSSVTSNNYYTLFTFNSTVHQYGAATNVNWGSLTVNVYDEENYNDVPGWSIFIKNSDGSSTYSNFITNTLVLDTTDLPIGAGSSITINATGYTTRTFYMDLFDNFHYNLEVYLAANTSVDSYLIRVINIYNQPINDCEVTINKFINSSYENISILRTDPNGYCTVSLIPNDIYQLILSAQYYVTAYKDLHPLTITYVEDRYHTFMLEFAEGAREEEVDVFYGINWTLEPNQHYHRNGFTVYYNITSDNSDLEWFRMVVSFYNTTQQQWVVISSTNISSLPGGGSTSYSISNVTGKYRVQIYFKKTNFSEYEITQTGSTVFQIYWGGFPTDVTADIPAMIFLAIIVIIMALVMGFLVPYAGLGTGYIGIGIFGFALLMKPDLVMNVTGVSGWAILTVTALIYTTGLFLWSRL